MLIIILFSIVMLVIINLFYRYLIDQDEVIAIKKRIKDLEKESKQHKDDATKTREYFGKIMDEQKKISKMSLKPMLVSFIVVIIFLPFLSAMYIDHSVTMQPIANSTMIAGNVTLQNIYAVQKNNNTITVLDKNNSLIIQCNTNTTCLKMIDNKEWKIVSEKIENNDVVKFYDIVMISPVNIPFLGYELGWIWFYILLSIPFSMVIKKLMGVKI